MGGKIRKICNKTENSAVVKGEEVDKNDALEHDELCLCKLCVEKKVLKV